MMKETRVKYDSWLELCSAHEGASFFSVGFGGTLAIYLAVALPLMLVQSVTPFPALAAWTWQVAFIYFFGYRVAKTVAGRKSLPVPWLWGVATVPASFLSASLVIGILAAMQSRATREVAFTKTTTTPNPNGALVWNKLGVYNAVFYYCAISIILIELGHRVWLKSSGGLVILLMLVFVGGCMKARRADSKVRPILFVFCAWVLHALLTAPYGLLLANPLYRIFGPLREDAIWKFLASVPVLFFAMRESRLYTSTHANPDDIVVASGWKYDFKILSIGGLVVPFALMLALSFAFVIDRRPFFNYPDPAVTSRAK